MTVLRDWKNKIPQILLSILFIIGYFTILALFILGIVRLSVEFKDVIILLIGILTREIPTIMQFWFGSSSGSKDKDRERMG